MIIKFDLVHETDAKMFVKHPNDYKLNDTELRKSQVTVIDRGDYTVTVDVPNDLAALHGWK